VRFQEGDRLGTPRGVKLTTHLRLVPRSRGMGGAVPRHPQYAFIAWCSFRGSTHTTSGLWRHVVLWYNTNKEVGNMELLKRWHPNTILHRITTQTNSILITRNAFTEHAHWNGGVIFVCKHSIPIFTHSKTKPLMTGYLGGGTFPQNKGRFQLRTILSGHCVWFYITQN